MELKWSIWYIMQRMLSFTIDAMSRICSIVCSYGRVDTRVSITVIIVVELENEQFCSGGFSVCPLAIIIIMTERGVFILIII